MATEEKRKADERESIRLEEVARIERENADKVKAEQDAAAEAALAVLQAATPTPAPAQEQAMARVVEVFAGGSAPAPAPQIAATAEPLTYTPSAGIRRATAEKPTLKLGEIGARLGFNVTADFLETLGFTATVEKNARLYKPSQFAAICTALQRHIASVAVKDYTEATQ
jgi:hypothetical protein